MFNNQSRRLLLMKLLITIVLACFTVTLAVNNGIKNDKIKALNEQLSFSSKEKRSYERYYCATEEMLDVIPEPTIDSLMCTQQGFRYLEEKALVDSLCHNVCP